MDVVWWLISYQEFFEFLVLSNWRNFYSKSALRLCCLRIIWVGIIFRDRLTLLILGMMWKISLVFGKNCKILLYRLRLTFIHVLNLPQLFGLRPSISILSLLFTSSLFVVFSLTWQSSSSNYTLSYHGFSDTMLWNTLNSTVMFVKYRTRNLEEYFSLVYDTNRTWAYLEVKQTFDRVQ